MPQSIRAFHTQIPGFWGGDFHARLPECERFIREVLAPHGVNVLVLEMGYAYQFKSVPKIGTPKGLSVEEVQSLVKVCRECGIKLVPEFNCLGHQSTEPGSLLGEYPQLREKPGQYPKFLKDPMPEQREGACYCPLDPGVHKLVFALLDELADVFEADVVHVGMDEVFAIASSNCPRCAERDPAELFAGEVKAIHDHLAAKGRKMWMWGDRFILASDHGFKEWGWASSRNGTHPAIDKVPTDILICDWHYEVAPPTPKFFVEKGFDVVAATWWYQDVALEQLKMMRDLSADPDRARAARAKGIMMTTWVEMQRFIDAWNGKVPALDKLPKWDRDGWEAAANSVKGFTALSAKWSDK
jgi:hypothetical protein